MTPDEILDDAACALGVPAPPPVLVALAETEPDLLTTAWAQGGSWFDSEFFEEAAVVAGAALEEVADELPPPDLMQVRLGGLGGSDVPSLDRALEGLVQAAPLPLLLTTAW